MGKLTSSISLTLDLKDRKLLYFLDQNSRMTNKELGRKVGLTEQAIGYRINRFLEQGVIKKFVAFINTPALGYSQYKVFLKLQNTSVHVEQQMIDYLVHCDQIRWVASTSGKYDLSFSVLAKDPFSFLSFYQSFEKEYGKYILEKNIVTLVYAPSFTRDYLFGKKESRLLEYGISKEKIDLDKKDFLILKSLSQSARKNIVAIAAELTLSVDVVKYRLEKLKKQNVINGFTLQLDLQKLGLEYYSVFFYTSTLSEKIRRQMLHFAEQHSHILYLGIVLGNYDFQLEFEVENYFQLEQELKEFRLQFGESIRDFEILRVTQEFKYNFFPFTV